MIKAWSDDAWEDLEYWMAQDRKTLLRILLLLKDLERNGYDGIGKPERLSGELSAYWSRRIDGCNRIVYRIDGDIMRIIQCGSHYRDR
jgi:toxin YoeB